MSIPTIDRLLDPSDNPTIEDSLDRIAAGLERIANRLDSWNSGGGLNIVPGTTLSDQLDDIAQHLKALR